MRVTLQLDDDTSEAYSNEALERGVDLEIVLAERLKMAQAMDPRSRYLLLIDNTLTRMEQALGHMPLLHAEDLIAKTQRLARVRFGDHELELTAGQMEEIAWRGEKQGKSIEEMLAMAWDRFKEEFFTLLPGKR